MVYILEMLKQTRLWDFWTRNAEAKDHAGKYCLIKTLLCHMLPSDRVTGSEIPAVFQAEPSIPSVHDLSSRPGQSGGQSSTLRTRQMSLMSMDTFKEAKEANRCPGASGDLGSQYLYKFH